MAYDGHGRFIGADVVHDGQNRYLQAADVAWGYAEPFPQWWDRHPMYHRQAV